MKRGVVLNDSVVVVSGIGKYCEPIFKLRPFKRSLCWSIRNDAGSVRNPFDVLRLLYQILDHRLVIEILAEQTFGSCESVPNDPRYDRQSLLVTTGESPGLILESLGAFQTYRWDELFQKQSIDFLLTLERGIAQHQNDVNNITHQIFEIVKIGD